MRPALRSNWMSKRNGQPDKVDVTVGEYHKNQEVAASTSDESGHARLGIAISDLTPDVRQQLNLPEQVQGVAVAQVCNREARRKMQA